MKHDGVWFEDRVWKASFKLVYEEGEYRKIYANGRLGYTWTTQEIEGLILAGSWVPVKQRLIKDFIKENL